MKELKMGEKKKYTGSPKHLFWDTETEPRALSTPRKPPTPELHPQLEASLALLALPSSPQAALEGSNSQLAQKDLGHPHSKGC